MEKLKQGDYVTNLTEEQFYELMNFQPEPFLKNRYIQGEENSLIIAGKNRTYIDIIWGRHGIPKEQQTELPFEVFKERAINTFKK